jgi:hypothetical protein
LGRVPGVYEPALRQVAQSVLGAPKRPEEHRLQVFGEQDLVLVYGDQDGALARVEPTH